MFEVRVGDLVGQLGGELIGDADLRLRRIAPLDSAEADSISFLSSPRHLATLVDSAAGCVIVHPTQREAVAARAAAILSADPYLYYARLSQWWARNTRPAPVAGIHPSAVIEPGARVHAQAVVGALCYVGAGAVIGRRAVIGAQCHVGADALVGEDTRLAAQAVVGRGCRIGARGIVHSGVVIGADGFGFAPLEGRWEKIEQLGGVDIGDDVEIGANTCIDRGALHDTVLEQGVKLDNLIQIAHNVRVGRHTAMAACVGVAGSTRIGAHCTFAGQVGVAGHLQIVDHVHVGAAATITRSILKPGSYGGFFPFDDNRVWEKNAASLRQLHALRARLRALENDRT
jgi:UDP-3-O-[3-hydroxymyristoyl] glucosamine N-acyltransferase